MSESIEKVRAVQRQLKPLFRKERVHGFPRKPQEVQSRLLRITQILLEDSFKTRSTYGPNRTDLTPLTFLTFFLKLYYSKMRPRLLSGKEHDYFFVNPRQGNRCLSVSVIV